MLFRFLFSLLPLFLVFSLSTFASDGLEPASPAPNKTRLEPICAPLSTVETVVPNEKKVENKPVLNKTDAMVNTGLQTISAPAKQEKSKDEPEKKEKKHHKFTWIGLILMSVGGLLLLSGIALTVVSIVLLVNSPFFFITLAFGIFLILMGLIAFITGSVFLVIGKNKDPAAEKLKKENEEREKQANPEEEKKSKSRDRKKGAVLRSSL